MLATLGAGVLAVNKAAEPVGVTNLLRWTTRDRALDLFGPPALMGLVHCPTYDDVLDGLRDAWSNAAMPSVANKRILVKPNLIDEIEGHPATTAPQTVGAVVDLLKELGAGEIAVGDGPGFRREAESVARACGLADVLAVRKTSFVDLNYDDPAPVPVRDGWFRHERELWLPRHVREADLIVSVPRTKTHHWAEVSLSLKNLFGLIPGCRYGWPKSVLHVNGIAPSIMGIYQTVRPVVAVIDGIIGMEGDGPLFGTAVSHGLLAVCNDPVAADVTCARLMGYEMQEVEYLHLAAVTGVGQTENIEISGADAATLRREYVRPPPSVAVQRRSAAIL